MINIRRWYIYLASAIIINVVAWATIVLLRNLLIAALDASKTDLALQISLIIVGTPLYLAHWLWAQRLAKREAEERVSFPRRLYLYGMMAAFLTPMLILSAVCINTLFHLAFDLRMRDYYMDLTLGEYAIYNLIAIITLALLWGYHRWIKSKDDRVSVESENSTILRHIYQYAFCGGGLVATIVALVNILHWLLLTLNSSSASPIGMGRSFLFFQLAMLIVGLPLWLVFWRQVQAQFFSPDAVERSSIVRKVYLYLVVFISIIVVVTTAAIVLSDLLGGWMNLPSGDGDIWLAISVVVVVGIAWAYHAFVLRNDANVAAEGEQQAQVRRIYLYMMAGVGLAAVLIGLGGVLSVFIHALAGRGFIQDLREQLSYFTATLIAGLPLWLLNWRQIQNLTAQDTEAWQVERNSVVRSFYLYFFIFVATMTALGSVVYIVAQLVELAIGARAGRGLVVDIGQAIAYTIIAVLVWLYHGTILRKDRQLLDQQEKLQLKILNVLILDRGDGTLGNALREALTQAVPSAVVTTLGVNKSAQEAFGPQEGSSEERLAKADVVVAPWPILRVGAAEQQGLLIDPQAVASCSAHKILLPVHEEGWDWVGVETRNLDSIIKEVIEAVKQLAAGEKAFTRRRLGAVTIIGLIVAVVGSLCLLMILVSIFMENF